MELIDTHSHLTALGNKDLNTVFENASEHSVNRMICVGASEGIVSAKDAVQLAETHENVWATIGIHPHDAGAFTTLEEIRHFAAHPKVVAIGETGLDFYRDWSPYDKQQILFENTIALAKECKKPLIIHCRDALEQTLETLIRLDAAQVGGVFHCYAGDADYAQKLREINFLVSFTGNITFNKAGALREAAAEIPLDQIMVETDCPYMAPEPYRGKPSEPMHVYFTAKKIAEVKQLTLEKVAAASTENAERLFGL